MPLCSIATSSGLRCACALDRKSKAPSFTLSSQVSTKSSFIMHIYSSSTDCSKGFFWCTLLMVVLTRFDHLQESLKASEWHGHGAKAQVDDDDDAKNERRPASGSNIHGWWRGGVRAVSSICRTEDDWGSVPCCRRRRVVPIAFGMGID